MPALIARTIRGIEFVAAAEAEAHGALVTGLGHREVWLDGDARRLIEMRTADDLLVECARVQGIDRARASLTLLGGAEMGLERALETARAVRALPPPRDFEVVASFLGRRNYNRFDVEDAIGAGLAKRTGWTYLSRRNGAVGDAGVTVRVHIRNEEALIGVRLAERPLHRRAYKSESAPGSLHPPLAAALAMLSGLRPGDALLDPCCGSGTIPIEAALLEPTATVLGSDLDRAAVATSKANARRARVRAAFALADAGRLPYPRGSVARVLSNVPWGEAVAPAGTLAREPRRLWSEIARVLAPGGRAVVLTTPLTDALPAGSGLTARLRIPISLRGAHPEIVVLSQEDDTTEPLPAALAEWWERSVV